MNSDQLKYFLAVARHLNFTEAAKDFYMTQPAISHQISELEEELGVRLFNRTTRTVLLTKAGEMFIEDAKKFLNLQEETLHKFRAFRSESNLSLKIGYLSGPCKTFLPELINKFHRYHPQVDISLYRYGALEIQNSMARGECDIYFSMTEDILKEKAYDSKCIFTDSFCIICRKDSPYLSGNVINLEKIAAEPFFMLNQKKAAFTVKAVSEICKYLNITPSVTGVCDTIEELLFTVESGLGFTMMPYRMKYYLQGNLAYIKLEVPVTCSISAAWKRNENPAALWFMELFDHELMLKR